jgi:serine/threonine-protein kinase
MKRILCLFALSVSCFLVPLAGSPQAQPRGESGESSVDAVSVSDSQYRSAGPDYGAIAYSWRTGAYGYGYNYPTRSSAERRALNECGSLDCRVVVWVRNACAALAENRTGEVAWAWDPSKDRAAEAALARCRSKGGQNCRILCAGCT